MLHCVFFVEIYFEYSFSELMSCSGNEDECLALSRALVSLLNWLYKIISYTIDELQKANSQSIQQNETKIITDEVEQKIVLQISEIIQCITSSSFLKSLLYIGKIEESVAWAHLLKTQDEVKAKIVLLGDKFDIGNQGQESPLKIINSFSSKIEWLQVSISKGKCFLYKSPIISVAFKQLTENPYYITYKTITYRSLHSILSFSVVLDKGNNCEVIANQIALVGRYFDISLPQLYFEVLQVCITNLVQFSYGDTKKTPFYSWAAFFLMEIPKIFYFLSKHSYEFRKHKTATGNVFSSEQSLQISLELLMEHSPILDLFEKIYDKDYFQKLFQGFESFGLIKDHISTKFLDQRKSIAFSSSSTPETRISSAIIFSVEKTFISVFKSFETNILSQDKLVGILGKMKQNIDLILILTSTQGKLVKFAQKLVEFNENALVPNAEDENKKSSQIRAVLFDMTFLLLCNLIQDFGLDVVTKNEKTKNSFFAKWCSINLTNRLLSSEIILKSYGYDFENSDSNDYLNLLMDSKEQNEFVVIQIVFLFFSS